MLTSSYRPDAGRFLISEPFMRDSNFQRTVVLLVEHGANGSLGFVVNRRLRVEIGEIVSSLKGCPYPVFLGGPVEQNTLHFVHKFGGLRGARSVAGDLYWGGDFEELKGYIQAEKVQSHTIRFFIGYSGWAPRQLEGELDQKSWIVAPSNTDFVFDEDENLWRSILRRMGGKFEVIANYPVDPTLN